ncbi:MAG: Crp/Fnr family transcriptional regulator [Lysobacterales bacterium]
MSMQPREILEHSLLFGSLPEQQLEQLAALAQIRAVPRQTLLFNQGDPGDALYGIASGKVLVYITAEDGKEFSLTVHETGDVLGEVALLDGRPRTAAARTMEDCQLLVIQRSHFEQLMDDNPKLARDLLTLLCDRLRWSSQLIEEFSLMPVEGRLARRLLTLAELLGKTSSEGVQLTISQSELAQFLGISRQIVNQYLQEWRQAGWLELARGKVVILDWEAIHQVCFQSSR